MCYIKTGEHKVTNAEIYTLHTECKWWHENEKLSPSFCCLYT